MLQYNAPMGLLRELKNSIGRDILLFGEDGMSYFGNLYSLQPGGIALLGPAILSSSGLVEIQNPAEVTASVNMSYVDLSQVLGLGTCISKDPFLLPPDEAESQAGAPEVSAVAATGSAAEDCRWEPVGPQAESRPSELARFLRTRIGYLAVIGTHGGYLFAGNLMSVEEQLAKLKVDYIFAPGGDGSTLFGVGCAVVSLPWITSVSS